MHVRYKVCIFHRNRVASKSDTQDRPKDVSCQNNKKRFPVCCGVSYLVTN